MNKPALLFCYLSAVVLIVFHSSCSNSQGNTDRRTSFDDGWHFYKGDPEGAEDPSFDDSGWRQVELPHDWSIEDLPNQSDSVIGPFSKSATGKMSTGYMVGGTAWYRKKFTLEKANQDKTVYLTFDGIYMNADIWINGRHAGHHPYGYTSFYYNITPYLNPAGQSNVIAVQVKNEGQNTRWYAGSGIYRHTWLTMVDPVHIDEWGVYVSTLFITPGSAEIAVQTEMLNSANEPSTITVRTEITDPSGQMVASAMDDIVVDADRSGRLKQDISIPDPILWSLDMPEQYTAKVTLLVDQKATDTYTASFGIRSIHFDAQSGFSLNGKPMLLKGGCFHHDNGPLGAVAIDRAEERKIEILKEAGFNAIRCSHNPPSPALLDACDRLGMLVIDEAFDMWVTPKNDDDYSNFFRAWWQKDVESWVVRDRNHPSVILWSIGNEIPEAGDTSGFRIARLLTAEVRNLDQTRGVTEAMVDFAEVMGGSHDWDDRAEHMDLYEAVGYNYGYTKYERDNQKYPERVIYASESMPPYAWENWQKVEALPYVVGDFTWTAMDYLGEAGVGLPRLIDAVEPGGDMPANAMGMFFERDPWPVFNDFQGDLDLIGNPKAPYYYRQVVWNDSPVEILVHQPIPEGKMEITSPWGFPDELKSWTWPGHENKTFQVHVYTRSPLVKLELNGRVIGEQSLENESSITATFEVPYEPGTLIARSYSMNGAETGADTLITTGDPAAIRLVADRSRIKADRDDLSYVMAEVIDSEGNVVPFADGIWINFEIAGNGEIAGVGSGSPDDMSSFQQPRKRSWQGRCLAIVRPAGKAGRITLTAGADGLEGSTIAIVAE